MSDVALSEGSTVEGSSAIEQNSDQGHGDRTGAWIFAAAAVALGLIGLIWGDFAIVWQPVPEELAYRQLFAYLAAGLLLIGGLALASGLGLRIPRLVRLGSILPTILYFIFALLWSRRIIHYPQLIGTWSGTAEELVLALAGIVTYARSFGRSERSLRVVRICRTIFGLCVVSFGLAHFEALKETAQMVPAWIPPGQKFWALATGAAHCAAGVSIVTGRLAALASRMLTAMFIGFGLLVWLPILIAAPVDHIAWAGNAINLALIAAAWIFAETVRGPNTEKSED